MSYILGKLTGLNIFYKKWTIVGFSVLLALEDMVGEKITKDNTMFYICGWQGTIDGVMDFLKPKNFVTQREKRADGSFEVKFESYG